MTQEDREAFRRFMRDADGRSEWDEGYCSLGNAGVSVGVEPGERIKASHVRGLLEHLSEARLLHMPTDQGDWRHILLLATGSGPGVARLVRLFEIATGVYDGDAFDEDLKWERIREWVRQSERLRTLGLLGPFEHAPAPARPALVRWAKEGGPIPAVDDSGAQMDLDLKGR